MTTFVRFLDDLDVIVMEHVMNRGTALETAKRPLHLHGPKIS